MLSAFVWDIRPEVFAFSPLPRWYGVIFAAGIVLSYFLMRHMFRREDRPVEWLDTLLMYFVVGMVVGMRLGHCLFYQPDHYLKNPIEIVMIWQGGYASHGGIIGILIALALYVRKYRDMTFLWLTDRIGIATMLGAGFIRIGNFFNSEMIGRPAPDMPWAVIFAQVDGVVRHPAQLYEALGYLGVAALGYMAYLWSGIRDVAGRLTGLVMILGFGWRFFCEFFKEDQVPFEQGLMLNMGQILSLPFMALGVVLLFRLRRPRQA